MIRVCPACGATRWQSLLRLTETGALTTDSRQVDRSLEKIVCTVCGLVTNAKLRGQEAIQDYVDNYEFNSLLGEEHYYFTSNGAVARSEAVFDWVSRHLPTSPNRLLEVGCGQGNLLRRLKDAMPDTLVTGVEASRHAVQLARANGLDVLQRSVAPGAEPLPAADAIVCFGVLEHVDDPLSFLSALRRSCRPGGQAVIAVPIQEQGGYDLFFEDHVWHFTMDHLRSVAQRAGWNVLRIDIDDVLVQGFGLIVITPRTKVAWSAPANAGALQAANRDTWLAHFASVNQQLHQLRDNALTVFGAGETFSLLYTYTHLRHCHIDGLVDDDVNRHGRKVLGLPVFGRDWLARQPDGPVFVAVNQRYHSHLADSLAKGDRRVVFWC